MPLAAFFSNMNSHNNNLLHTLYWQHDDDNIHVSSISMPGVVGRGYMLPYAFRVTSQPPIRNLSTIQTNSHPRQISTITQNKGVEKLRREIYNPGTHRVSLYYRDRDFRAKKNDNEDGKRCTVCLDDFESGEMVTLTPCNHMFHENCIIPWVTSHGQCPVCRFVISDQSKENEGIGIGTGIGIGNNREVVGGDPIPRDLIDFIREVEGRG